MKAASVRLGQEESRIEEDPNPSPKDQKCHNCRSIHWDISQAQLKMKAIERQEVKAKEKVKRGRIIKMQKKVMAEQQESLAPINNLA